MAELDDYDTGFNEGWGEGYEAGLEDREDLERIRSFLAEALDSLGYDSGSRLFESLLGEQYDYCRNGFNQFPDYFVRDRMRMDSAGDVKLCMVLLERIQAMAGGPVKKQTPAPQPLSKGFTGFAKDALMHGRYGSTVQPKKEFKLTDTTA